MKWRNSVRPRQGSPQRGDIVFIAEALSQVSHPWAGGESEKKYITRTGQLVFHIFREKLPDKPLQRDFTRGYDITQQHILHLGDVQVGNHCDLLAVLDGSLVVTLCINCRFVCIYMNDIAPKSHTNHAAINSLSSERICEKEVTKQPIKQPIKRTK